MQEAARHSYLNGRKLHQKMRDVSKYLTTKQSSSDPELAVQWGKLESFYNKKLWHQLTIELLQFVKHPSLQTGNELVQLYENFIADFENKYEAHFVL